MPDHPMTIRNITVYCSSSNHAPRSYFDTAEQLGRELARRNIGLVFGGGNIGLMGCVADAVMHGGGIVRGVIPRLLEEREVAHYGISELHVVESMHERKMKLTEWGDAFVVLPGGFGTLDELMEIMTWKHLGYHRKPILLLNCEGFWNPLLSFFDRISEKGMVKSDHASYYTICNSCEEIFSMLKTLCT